MLRPLVVASLVTGGLTWLAGRPEGAAAGVAALAAPLVLAVGWTVVATHAARPRWPWAAAAAGLLLGAAGTSVLVVVTCAGYVAAGLLGGLALRRHWRPLATIGAMTLVLVPGFVAGLLSVPLEETFAPMRDEMVAAAGQQVPADATPAEREAAIAEFERQFRRVEAVLRRVWPSLMLAGLMTHAAVAWLLGRWLARRTGAAGVGPVLDRPFVHWTAPHGVVWALAAGLLLLLVGDDGPGLVGLNLALVAGGVLAVQGLAVQVWLIARLLPPVGRVAYWLLVAFFFLPLVLVAGAVIGLVDQWRDLRALEHNRGYS